MAFWAGDLNPSFATRDSYFLLASRTPVNMMCLALQHHTFLMEEPAADLCGLSKKELIFVGTFINISGKHPVIGINNEHPGKERQLGIRCPSGDQHNCESQPDCPFS